MKIVKNILRNSLLLFALSTGFVSCSKDELADEITTQNVVSVGDLKFVVGDFPSTGLRSVAGYEEGKTCWEAGDEIVITLNNFYDGEVYYKDVHSYLTFRYDGSSWVNKEGTVLPFSTKGLEVNYEAFYDPGNELTYNANKYVNEYKKDAKCTSMLLRSAVNGQGLDEPIKLIFHGSPRIRIHGVKGEQITVSGKNLYKHMGKYEDSYAFGENVYTANDNGNVILYCSWRNNAAIIINGESYDLPNGIDESECAAYVIDLTKNSDVQIDEDSHTITLLKDGQIIPDYLSTALGEGNELIVKGSINQKDLKTIVDFVSGLDDKCDLDLSGTSLTSIDDELSLSNINKIKFPSTLNYIEDYAIYFEDAPSEVWFYSSSITLGTEEEPFDAGKKTLKSIKSSTTLHLNSAVTADDNEWGGLEFKSIIYDAN